MKRILKTIVAENGKLYCTSEGSRRKLVSCNPLIRVMEETKRIPAMGSVTYIKTPS